MNTTSNPVITALREAIDFTVLEQRKQMSKKNPNMKPHEILWRTEALDFVKKLRDAQLLVESELSSLVIG